MPFKFGEPGNSHMEQDLVSRVDDLTPKTSKHPLSTESCRCFDLKIREDLPTEALTAFLSTLPLIGKAN